MRGFRNRLTVLIAVAAIVASSNNVLASFVEAEPGKDLRWRGRVVRLGISASFFSENSAIKVGSDVRGALTRSLESWEKAGNVTFETFEISKQNVSSAGNSGDGVSLLTIAGSSENLLFLGKDESGLPAATRVFFDRKGNITEADIVLNPTEQFSTDGTFGTFDLESVLVHEIGHLLGLTHVELPGATMHDSVPRNGLYGLAYLRSRTLSEIDVAMVRELYGESSGTLDCCGSVIGAVTMPNGRPARGIEVFLESADSGRVFGQAKTDNTGKVNFSSVPIGNYRIAAAGAKTAVALERLLSDGVEVEANEQAVVTLPLIAPVAAAHAFLIGYNGQLSMTPVSMSTGGVNRVYIGVPEKFVRKLVVGSTSPNVKIILDSMLENSQYEGLRVISFEIEIESDTPDGEYSLVIGSDEFGTAYLPGVISIDRRLENIQLQPRRGF